MTEATCPHFRDTNDWQPPPESEADRLQLTLSQHLTKIGTKMSKADRAQLVEKLLTKQNKTCVFAKNVNGMYCWNEPKENYVDDVYTELPYLKLQWGHIKPRCHMEEKTIDDLCLLCARCNNQIQTSRYLHKLNAKLL